jgi:hypothetical protein
MWVVVYVLNQILATAKLDLMQILATAKLDLMQILATAKLDLMQILATAKLDLMQILATAKLDLMQILATAKLDLMLVDCNVVCAKANVGGVVCLQASGGSGRMEVANNFATIRTTSIVRKEINQHAHSHEYRNFTVYKRLRKQHQKELKAVCGFFFFFFINVYVCWLIDHSNGKR